MYSFFNFYLSHLNLDGKESFHFSLKCLLRQPWKNPQSNIRVCFESLLAWVKNFQFSCTYGFYLIYYLPMIVGLTQGHNNMHPLIHTCKWC